ncbi:histidine phosphatase family protein [Geomicrobium sp. JCM 19038]|uniref:histidine phosphatase family protein n=1 Tax=Geomicrobium sp. JCM 19038 TaxID=1460635 RepID=UPI00045F31DA|nr:histidine phosphatase family protein [Geomicrobium sp. JCM 19038]GAK09884.1 phosphoglycerate mutase family 2 [Geomicrobium sp. JCM 19038]
MNIRVIYVVRHCEAKGQAPEAELTVQGRNQALEVAKFFKNKNISHIISSPYERAFQTIKPFARQNKLSIETTTLLSERVLSTKNEPDWLEKLQATFEDMELKYEGGESSVEAQNRIVEVIEHVKEQHSGNTVVVTHGVVLSLLLKTIGEFDFSDWQGLRNPDIFQLIYERDQWKYQRVW